jgi:hypothetical protein
MSHCLSQPGSYFHGHRHHIHRHYLR